MNDSLQQVVTAALQSARHKAGDPSTRPVLHLCAADTDAPAKLAPAPREISGREISGRETSGREFAGREAELQQGGDIGELGRDGLRLAFWLCGFHEVLTERQRKGEALTEREQALMTLSRKDFSRIRPLVVGQALGRLEAVVNAPDLLALSAAANAGQGPQSQAGQMEMFALDAVRGLSRRAQQLLRDAGPDAAMSLFDKGVSPQEPLAIFQSVFTTALGLVEAFAKLTSADARLLPLLADALGSEVERI